MHPLNLWTGKNISCWPLNVAKKKCFGLSWDSSCAPLVYSKVIITNSSAILLRKIWNKFWVALNNCWSWSVPNFVFGQTYWNTLACILQFCLRIHSINAHLRKKARDPSKTWHSRGVEKVSHELFFLFKLWFQRSKKSCLREQGQASKNIFFLIHFKVQSL